MEIIIGRDGATSRLCITVDGTPSLIGNAGSVPNTVSRKHCALTINDDGTMHIKNINPQNMTFVNGLAVMSKTVTRSDKVELGTDNFQLNWDLIDKAMPKEADVRPLQAVWDTYNNDNKTLTQSTQRFQVFRSIIPVFTMSAVLIGYISGGRGMVFFLLYGIIIALTIFLSWKAWKDIAKNDEQREEIKNSFTHNYCCPQCGYFFGFTDYRILTKNMDNCPKCKTKLKK